MTTRKQRIASVLKRFQFIDLARAVAFEGKDRQEFLRNYVDRKKGAFPMCGNSIRHVYFVGHDKWPSLEVGETCCDHLTSTHEASARKRFLERLERFIVSPRWKADGAGGLRILQKRMAIAIQSVDQEFCVVVDDNVGRLRFPTTVDAKRFVLESVENGKFETYLERRRKRRD